MNRCKFWVLQTRSWNEFLYQPLW